MDFFSQFICLKEMGCILRTYLNFPAKSKYSCLSKPKYIHTSCKSKAAKHYGNNVCSQHRKPGSYKYICILPKEIIMPFISDFLKVLEVFADNSQYSNQKF